MNDSESTDCFPAFSTPDFVNVGVVRGVLSAISILMCCIALFLIVLLKRWTVFSQKLTIYLLVSALLSSLGHIISIDYNHGHYLNLSGFCAFSAFVWQVTIWMLQNAILAVTVYLFFLIVLDFNTDKYQWLYIACVFGVPFLFNWIPFVRSTYGRSGAWCWIRELDESSCESDAFGLYLQYIMYYGPVYLLLLIGTILYIIIFIDISIKQRKPAWVQRYDTRWRLKKMKTELLSLIVYPVIFAVLNIPLTINRAFFLLHPDQPVLALWYLAAVCSPLHGGFAAVASLLITKEWRNLSCTRLRAVFKKNKLIEQYAMEANAATDSYDGPRQEYAAYT